MKGLVLYISAMGLLCAAMIFLAGTIGGYYNDLLTTGQVLIRGVIAMIMMWIGVALSDHAKFI